MLIGLNICGRWAEMANNYFILILKYFVFCALATLNGPFSYLTIFSRSFALWTLIMLKDFLLAIDNHAALTTAVATLILAGVGYFQLKKLHLSNSLNILFKLDYEWDSQRMRKRRKNLSSTLRFYLKKERNLNEISETDWVELQNIVEDVIDLFEKIGHLLKRKYFELETVYQMNSYYIQGYWEMCKKTGYVDKLRKEKEDNDFYNQFEWLYDTILKKYKLKAFTEKELLDFCEEEIATIDS